MSGSQSNLEMISKIEVNLESGQCINLNMSHMQIMHFSAVGKYGKQSASKYCFQVKDLSVSVDDDSERYNILLP